MRLVLAFASVALLCARPAIADDIDYRPTYPGYSGYFKRQIDWSGFYAGINSGVAFGNSNWASVNSFGVSGGFVGATGGYNYQIDQVVFGIEGDINVGHISGSTSINCPSLCGSNNTWLGTLRGRIGYALDDFLPYLTAGAAAGDLRASATGYPGDSAAKFGWAAGFGVEYAFSDRWSLRGEYLHVAFDSLNCGVSCGLVAPSSVSINENLIRAALTFHFGVSDERAKGIAYLGPRKPKPGDTDDPGPRMFVKKQQKKHTNPMMHSELIDIVPLPPKREIR